MTYNCFNPTISNTDKPEYLLYRSLLKELDNHPNRNACARGFKQGIQFAIDQLLAVYPELEENINA